MNVLCMKCGGDILAPPALCGYCARAIPPREPTQAMIDAAVGIDLIKTGWRGGVAILWKQMYDAAIAEKEVK